MVCGSSVNTHQQPSHRHGLLFPISSNTMAEMNTRSICLKSEKWIKCMCVYVSIFYIYMKILVFMHLTQYVLAMAECDVWLHGFDLFEINFDFSYFKNGYRDLLVNIIRLYVLIYITCYLSSFFSSTMNDVPKNIIAFGGRLYIVLYICMQRVCYESKSYSPVETKVQLNELLALAQHSVRVSRYKQRKVRSIVSEVLVNSFWYSLLMLALEKVCAVYIIWFWCAGFLKEYLVNCKMCKFSRS